MYIFFVVGLFRFCLLVVFVCFLIETNIYNNIVISTVFCFAFILLSLSVYFCIYFSFSPRLLNPLIRAVFYPFVFI